MSVGKPAFSRLPGGIKCAILQSLFVCKKCDSSAATHAACGVLLSPSSHAEWFVLRTLGEPLRRLFVMLSLCKYACCTTGGLPIIWVCGLCPVSAEGEFEKDGIVVE